MGQSFLNLTQYLKLKMRKEDITFNKYFFIGLTILVVIVITINVAIYFI